MSDIVIQNFRGFPHALQINARKVSHLLPSTVFGFAIQNHLI
jgi:hypothetical protein